MPANFLYLGLDPASARREWRRLKLFVGRDSTLASLSYSELYSRLFNQFSNKKEERHYWHILIVALVSQCIAMDTSICERGFSTMNLLKTARRATMSTELLRALMTVCELGKEWRKNPSSIPVEEIVNEWRSQSTRGRYEAAMWRAAGLDPSAF